jgi:hypothetical protein
MSGGGGVAERIIKDYVYEKVGCDGNKEEKKG